ncbi:hypothetical protein D3C81_1544210 [compost metagenome]
MRKPPHMPQLANDLAASRMHGIRDQLPASHLLVRPDARCQGIAARLRRNIRRLADDQAGAGPLGVVLGVHGVRHAIVAHAAARERRHDDAVGQRQRAQLDWRK